MPKSTYTAAATLNLLLRNTAFTPPTSVYIAIFNGVPGSGGTEATGAGYARQAASFSLPAPNVTSNTGVITFSNMPAIQANYIAIMDAATAGNVLIYAAAANPKTVNTGDTVSISIGGLTITET